MALRAAGVGRDDEVVLPTLTFIATAGAIAHCGAHPVFLDSEPVSWGLDPAPARGVPGRASASVRAGQVIDRATGRRVSALLPVHLYGHPCDLDPLLELCRRWPLAAGRGRGRVARRALSRPPGRRRRLAGCLSFNGNKIITTGGGGMVLTRDEALAARVRALTTQARSDPLEWVHDEVGFNYRLTNLQAALGAAQLEQLEDFVDRKRATAVAYPQALGRARRRDAVPRGGVGALELLDAVRAARRAAAAPTCAR